jgi:broad specificity phosphatase PhoE
MPTPRVFVMRHGKIITNLQLLKLMASLGQTEWSQNGRYTGSTDIPLTEIGEAQVQSTAKIVYGKGKLIDPSNLAHVYISPRTRAQKTFSLLTEGQVEGSFQKETTEDLAEWGYGLYEGLVTKEIRKERKERGLDTETEWDIWRDGCEGGEYVYDSVHRPGHFAR